MMVLACLALLQMGCDSSQDGSCAQLLSEVEAMEQSLLAGGEDVNVELRAKMMQAYAQFANTCHDHEFTPEALFRRAAGFQVASSTPPLLGESCV